MLFSSTNRANSVSLQAFKLIADHIQHMYDRIARRKGIYYRRQRWKIILMVFAAICFLIAVAAFSYQTYLSIDHYMDHEIQQTSTTTLNRSLSMPIVTLQVDTYRNTAQKSIKPPITMNFDASLDGERLSMWAFKEFHIIQPTSYYSKRTKYRFLARKFHIGKCNIYCVPKNFVSLM